MSEVTMAASAAENSLAGDNQFDTIPMEDMPASVRGCVQNIRLNGWMLGGMLASAKRRIPHGGFMDWLREHTDISQTTANDLMGLYEGVQQTPFLMEMKQSAAIALLALPADEREDFARQHDAESLSVRQLKEAIAREKALREEAEQEAATADLATQAARRQTEEVQQKLEESAAIEARAVGYANKAAEKLATLQEEYYQAKQHANKLEAALVDATKPEAIAIEVEKRVEVPPADYEALKATAESAASEIAAAHDYAVEMERKAQAAQAELRKLRDSQQEGGSGAHDLPTMRAAVSEFLGRVALLPTTWEGCAISREDAAAYGRCIALVAEWCEESQATLAAMSLRIEIEGEIV